MDFLLVFVWSYAIKVSHISVARPINDQITKNMNSIGMYTSWSTYSNYFKAD